LGQKLKIGNSVRAAIWIFILTATLLSGKMLDKRLELQCNHLFCLAIGTAWFAVIVRAAAVTGRYLAVYGKSNCRKRFGEIDRLVKVGPYSCMRHPMHFFLSQLPPALALMIGSLSGVLVGFVFTGLILYMAVTLDEKESLERFGEDYLNYKREVPAINLHPSCIMKALLKMPKKHCKESNSK
jgi:protein-S-isoprenylcysteine O-methyltransferase Ste14